MSGIVVSYFIRKLALRTERNVSMPGFKPTLQCVPKIPNMQVRYPLSYDLASAGVCMIDSEARRTC